MAFAFIIGNIFVFVAYWFCLFCSFLSVCLVFLAPRMFNVNSVLLDFGDSSPFDTFRANLIVHLYLFICSVWILFLIIFLAKFSIFFFCRYESMQWWWNALTHPNQMIYWPYWWYYPWVNQKLFSQIKKIQTNVCLFVSNGFVSRWLSFIFLIIAQFMPVWFVPGKPYYRLYLNYLWNYIFGLVKMMSVDGNE